MIGYNDMMETIAITTEFIRLQDLLKLAGLTATGGETTETRSMESMSDFVPTAILMGLLLGIADL